MLLAAALAGPYLPIGEPGRDLLIVADRSKSLPSDATKKAVELIALAEKERARTDRVGIITFGANAAVERLPSADAVFSAFEREVNLDGSDLGEAIETALNLIPEGRQGSILVISDGIHNGRDPVAVARRAYLRGIPVHVVPTVRERGGDLSVERLDLPEAIAAGEPFQFTVWVRADARTETSFELSRRGKVISSGKRVFEPGMNRLVFRDLVEDAGIADYRVHLGTDDDRIPENNRGLAGVKVEGPRPVLLVNSDGAPDSLSSAISSAGIPLRVVSAKSAALDRVGLASVRAVILENVPYADLRGGGAALAEFVEERGGGLLMTGGRASFSLGGYYKSPIERVLPVSMELRKEHRKQGVAIAIAMDRSGSMAMPVGNRMVKMDLANLGAASAIELLSPIDSVAVIAVDSAAHVIQQMTPATNTRELVDSVKSIRSMGGGIFCYAALVAAAAEINAASQKNRHIILFADASDSEQQEGCKELVERLRQSGVTISVIGLGKESDPDGAFLKSVAEAGNGKIYFTMEPSELPRLFAQDTLTVARSTFVDERTATAALPNLFGLGEISREKFPSIDGYNLTYLRSGASSGAVTLDDYKAPLLAFWYAGVGRTAAYTGQIGGSAGSDLVAWSGFSSLFVTLTRWLSGQEEPESVFPSIRREGKDAVIAVELDADAPVPPETAQLKARMRSASGRPYDVVLTRVDEHRYEGRMPLTEEGIAVGAIQLGADRVVSLPPVALPHSPEFERPPDPGWGERQLKQIAEESGGVLQPDARVLFEGSRASKGTRLIARELSLVALLLLLLDIAARRLLLWESIGIPRRRAVQAEAKPPAMEATKASGPAPVPRAPGGAPTTTEPAAAPPKESLSSALAKAKKAAGRELER
ncbi:MAG: VWA domain-containing protein [Planctomycetes bacterium]|nr:VWA domain-containing protein [Planctomycetota bacterium]